MPTITPATLLIVTFNQERFILNTFRAALAQDYEKLQIVVADDGSTDNTINIIEEEIRIYEGPHSINIISCLPNIGLFGNIQRGVQQSTGDIIVISAGDDIPLPYRVSAMVKAWKYSAAVSLHSKYDIINEFGQVIEQGIHAEAPGHPIWSLFQSKHDRRFVGGAAAAYSRSFLATFPETKRRIFHEDSMLTIAAHAIGAVTVLVPVSTLQYRVHNGSYSNASFSQQSKKDIVTAELAYVKFAKDTLSYMEYLRLEWIPSQKTADGILAVLDASAMALREESLRSTINALSNSPFVRFANLVRAKRTRQLRPALLRLAGVDFFATTKSAAIGIKLLLKRGSPDG